MKTIKTFAPLVFLSVSILLVIYQLYQSFSIWKKIEPSQETVTKWVSHVQPLREALPTDVVHIGYLDSSIILEIPNLFDVEEFLLMQYSIAPYVLEMGTRPEWVIGNFDNDTEFQIWLDKNIGNYKIQEFGFSLFLIQKIENNP